jgi:hypothetical protein
MDYTLILILFNDAITTAQVTVFARVQAAIFDKNLPSKIGERRIHGFFMEKLDPPKKSVILLTTKPATPVLYVVKLPVETASV